MFNLGLGSKGPVDQRLDWTPRNEPLLFAYFFQVSFKPLNKNTEGKRNSIDTMQEERQTKEEKKRATAWISRTLRIFLLNELSLPFLTDQPLIY